MADTSSTKLRLRTWAAAVAREGLEAEVDLLIQGVPRGAGPSDGPRLAETQVVIPSEFGGAISYTSDKANLTNTGVGPHWIRARTGKVLRFVWPAGPPELASPRGSATFYFPQVYWVPGYGVANNIGWWDKRVNAQVWSQVLQGARSRVTF